MLIESIYHRDAEYSLMLMFAPNRAAEYIMGKEGEGAACTEHLYCLDDAWHLFILVADAIAQCPFPFPFFAHTLLTGPFNAAGCSLFMSVHNIIA